jgi:hypothetical protein
MRREVHMETIGDLKNLKNWITWRMEEEGVRESRITLTISAMRMNVYLPVYCNEHQVQIVDEIIYNHVPACIYRKIILTNNFSLFDV